MCGGRTTLTVAALCLAPGMLHGQEVDVGARVGLGLSGILWGDAYLDEQTDPAPGFQLGFFAERELSGFSFALAELRYSRRGAGDGGAQPGTFVMDYVEMPITVGLRTSRDTSLHIRAGPVLGYDVRCQMTGVAVLGSVACDHPVAGMDLRGFEVGALLGVGVEKPLGGRRYSLELQGTLGLQDLTSGPLPPGSARSVFIALTLGIHDLFGSEGNAKS